MAGQMVEFGSNGANAAGYLARPASGSGPGVIVIQEWWGLVDHIKALADRFAAEGFFALAPDLYHGDSTTSPDDAGRLMMALDIERAISELGGAEQYLLGLDGIRGTTAGVVGFCMGGRLALAAACKRPQIGACVNFYGVHPNVSLDLSGLQAPVLGLFGENDGFVAQEDVRKLEHELQQAGRSATFHVYPGADHAFFNDSRPDVYNEEAAGDAWNRTLDFFREHLG